MLGKIASISASLWGVVSITALIFVTDFPLGQFLLLTSGMEGQKGPTMMLLA